MAGDTQTDIRPSATVILARDAGRGLEIFLLRRSTKSGFMGGLFVFPGGVVEPEDNDPAFFSKHTDMDPLRFKERFQNEFDAENVMAFCVAAVRETLEEAGVFIAGQADPSPTTLQAIVRQRLEPDLPGTWFKEALLRDKWRIKLSALFPWSRWITPVGMPKRFDTCFFLAPMPPGQTCAADGRETGQGTWISPSKALKQNLAGTIPLSPPGIVTVTELQAFPDMASLEKALANRSWGDTMVPRLVKPPAGPVILEPWDPAWSSDDNLEGIDFSQKVLPAGSSFSRVWCDNGVWKPLSR